MNEKKINVSSEHFSRGLRGFSLIMHLNNLRYSEGDGIYAMKSLVKDRS